MRQEDKNNYPTFLILGLIALAFYMYIENKHLSEGFAKRVTTRTRDTVNIDGTAYIIKYTVIGEYSEPQDIDPPEDPRN